MRMAYRMTRRSVVSVFLLFGECLLISLCSSSVSLKTVHTAMKGIGIMAIACMAFSVYAIYRIRRKWVNAFLIFIVFAYLFSFGQCMMAVFNVELKNTAYSLSRGYFSAPEIQRAAVFALRAIAVTCIGYCFSDRAERHPNAMPEDAFDEKRKRIVSVGWLLLALSFAPTLYMLLSDIQKVSTSSYGATLEKASGLRKVCSLLSNYFISAILILFCFEDRKRGRLYALITGYLALQIAGGSRIETFRLAITFLLISERYRKELTGGKRLLLAVTALAGIFVFSAVSDIRNQIHLSADVPELMIHTVKNVWEDNFLVSAINEMGNTQLINTLVYSKCPEPVPFQYGLSYLKMLWAIVPNFIGSAYTGYIGVDITFSPLYTVTEAGMGASFIAEGYWNFGSFSVLLFFFFGALYGWIEKRFCLAGRSKSGKPENIFLLIYTMYYFIFLVRSEALGFGRSFVYYAVIPYFMCKINERHRNEKKTLRSKCTA